MGIDRVRPFYRELRHRRVFRVAAAYAIACWAVIEVVDVVVPALGIPTWVVTAVIVCAGAGLPLALIVAWAYDLTPEGIERAPTGAAAADPRVSRARPWLVVAPAVVLLAAGAFLALGRGHAAPDSPTAVAVFPFAVRGSPDLDYLREGLADLIGRSLDGGGLHGVDPALTMTAVRRRGGDLDPGAAAAVTHDLGASYFVLGSLTEASGRVRISAALYDHTAPDSALARVDEDGDVSGIFGLVDRVSAGLVAARFGPASAALLQTAADATTSPAALRDFLRAEQWLRSMDYDSAIAALQRAIGRDSTFSLAYYRLAVASGLHSRSGAAPDAMDRALRHADRLSLHERRLLEAYALFQAGRADEAEHRYRAFVKDYPDDVEARFQLGDLLYRYNPMRGRSLMEAAPEFDLAMEADPKFFCPL